MLTYSVRVRREMHPDFFMKWCCKTDNTNQQGDAQNARPRDKKS